MSALTLKLFACVCMLLDHLGYCIPEFFPLRIVGRLAFPLYVFLLTEGFRHTSSRLRYTLRLFVFALLSQVPFGLFLAKDPFCTKLNVMVTLLLSLIGIWVTELGHRKPVTRLLSWLFVLCLCMVFWMNLLDADYGAKGILLAQAFYAFGNQKGKRGAALLTLGLLVSFFHVVLLEQGFDFLRMLVALPKLYRWPDEWTWMQLFTLLTVPLILSYNGEKGPAPSTRFLRKLTQYAFYAFYPIHMLILYVTIR